MGPGFRVRADEENKGNLKSEVKFPAGYGFRVYGLGFRAYTLVHPYVKVGSRIPSPTPYAPLHPKSPAVVRAKLTLDPKC